MEARARRVVRERKCIMWREGKCLDILVVVETVSGATEAWATVSDLSC